MSPFATTFAQALIDFDFNVKTFSVLEEVVGGDGDGQGGYPLSWENYNTTSGFIFPMTAAEKIAAGRLETDQLFKFLVYPFANTNPKMKIVYNGKDYNIRSTLDVAEDGSLMIIIAEKGAGV